MILLLSLLAILGIAYLSYALYIKPLKERKHYVKLFKSKGYKIHEFPFSLFSAPYYRQWLTASKQKQHSFYYQKTQYFQYDVLISNIFNRLHVIVINPEMIKELTSPDKLMYLTKRPSDYLSFSSIFSKGLIFLQKDDWKHHRKIISKVFNYDFIVEQIPTMIAVANKVFDEFEENFWRENPEKKQEKKVNVELSKMMVKFTSSVVMSGFLGLQSMKQQLKGKTIQEQVLRLSEVGMTLAQQFIILFGLKFIERGWRKIDRQYLALKNQINIVLMSYIKKCKEQVGIKEQVKKEQNDISKKTIIHLLIEQNLRAKSDKSCPEITDEQLLDQIKTFVIAGSDTTSNFLTSTVLSIFENPRTAQRLRDEINSIIKTDEDINLENMKKMKYLECVMAQSSRIHSVSGGLFDRTLSEDILMFGIPLSKGFNITGSWMPCLSNPQLFDNPLEYIPERWQKEENKQNQHIVALTFSSGPRNCIGKNLAMMEAKVMLIKFMKRYGDLFELQKDKRTYLMGLTLGVVNTNVELTRSK